MTNTQADQDKKKPRAVEAPEPDAAPRREPSRMMGLLIVDVLAARKVTPPAPKKTSKQKRA